ncbi:MAG: DUF2071 domain-containing protein [Ardenticatenales bacterium]|nr:DUF2071 domain-containing protein [Ardenticatenales bacterium]
MPLSLPALAGTIDRRILINYRVDPTVLAPHVPPPFRLKTVHGHAIAGICLIRLRQLRPAGLPAWLGVGSENTAHRIAVEWDADGRTHTGVYVPRRDTASRLNVLAGGRLFEGYQHHARFDVHETATHLEVAVHSDDGVTRLAVVADVVAIVDIADAADITDAAARPLPGSTFASLAEASAFFEAGAVGYSDTPTAGRYQGLELCCREWRVEPLVVQTVQSSFFDDPARFPPGSVAFDNALLMRGVAHTWRGRVVPQPCHNHDL